MLTFYFLFLYRPIFSILADCRNQLCFVGSQWIHLYRTGIYGYGYGWEISYPRQPCTYGASRSHLCDSSVFPFKSWLYYEHIIRVAVDMKFPIHIHIHRFCVDIHGYIHIHRCLSCIDVGLSTDCPQSTVGFYCMLVLKIYKRKNKILAFDEAKKHVFIRCTYMYQEVHICCHNM